MCVFMSRTQSTKRVEVVLGKRRLLDAVHVHPGAVLLGEVLARAAREHVHLDALAHEALGELAHVPAEPALDDRGVLPGDDQDARHGRGAYTAASARPPWIARPDARARARRASQRSAGASKLDARARSGDRHEHLALAAGVGDTPSPASTGS